MAGRDIAHVKGWVLTHQDDGNVFCKIQPNGRIKQAGCVLHTLNARGSNQGRYAALLDAHVIGTVDQKLHAARLCDFGQGKSGVSVDIDGFERIHLDRNAKAHEAAPFMGRRPRDLTRLVIGADQFPVGLIVI